MEVSARRRILNWFSCSWGVFNSGAGPGALGTNSNPSSPSRASRWRRIRSLSAFAPLICAPHMHPGMLHSADATGAHTAFQQSHAKVRQDSSSPANTGCTCALLCCSRRSCCTEFFKRRSAGIAAVRPPRRAAGWTPFGSALWCQAQTPAGSAPPPTAPAPPTPPPPVALGKPYPSAAACWAPSQLCSHAGMCI